MLHIESLPPIKEGGRLIVVGDIHGCLGEFNSLIDKCKYNPSRGDVLLLLGDLVNKGYDSVGVVRRAIELKARCILGNHDVALLNHYYAPEMLRAANGDNSSEPPADPLWQLAQGFPADCIDYLKALPYIYLAPQFNLIAVHAGLNPRLPLEEQSVWELIHMRSIDERSGVCSEDLRGALWASTWRGPQHVVFGHDARTGLQQHEFATGLDTGCCYGKHLTAMIFPGKELVQVRSRFTQTKEARTAAGVAKSGRALDKLSPTPVSISASASPTSTNNNNNVASPGFNNNYSQQQQQQQQQQQFGPTSTPTAMTSSPGFNQNNNNPGNGNTFSGINVAHLLTGQKRVTSNSSPPQPNSFGGGGMGTPAQSDNTPPTLLVNNNSNNNNLGFNLTEFANKLNGNNNSNNNSSNQSQQNAGNGNDNIMRFFSNSTPNNNNNNNNATSSTSSLLPPAPRTKQNSTPQSQQQQQQQSKKGVIYEDDDDEVIVSSTKQQQVITPPVSSTNNAAKKPPTSNFPVSPTTTPTTTTTTTTNNTTSTTTTRQNQNGTPSSSTYVPTATAAQQSKTPTCSRALAIRELCTAGLPRTLFENVVLQLLDPNSEHHASHQHSNVFDSIIADATIREAVWVDIGAGLLSRLDEGKRGDDMLLLAQDVFTAKPEIAKQIVKMAVNNNNSSSSNNTIIVYLNGILSAGKEKTLNLNGLGLTAETIKDTVVCLK